MVCSILSTGIRMCMYILSTASRHDFVSTLFAQIILPVVTLWWWVPVRGVPLPLHGEGAAMQLPSKRQRNQQAQDSTINNARYFLSPVAVGTSVAFSFSHLDLLVLLIRNSTIRICTSRQMITKLETDIQLQLDDSVLAKNHGGRTTLDSWQDTKIVRCSERAIGISQTSQAMAWPLLAAQF